MRKVLEKGLPFVLVALTCLAVGFVLGRGKPAARRAAPTTSTGATQPVAAEPTPAADPGWPLGARVQVGYTDPHKDQHARGLVEVVRIVEADGAVSMTPDGKHDAPRVEWKFHFDSGRSYYAVPRER